VEIHSDERDSCLSEYEALRERHVATAEAMLPDYVARIEWPAGRLQAERLRALRALVAAAVRGSPWHRERLAEFDTTRMTESDIEALPVMTKSDLMEHFDAIVTDRRLSREICERHLDGLKGDGYLLGEYHVVASGGSTGQRGVYVYGWDAWATCWASMMRFPQRDWRSDPTLAGVSRVAVVVAASKATHVSAAFRLTFSTPRNREHLLPVSLPLERIVASLNRLQPTEVIGYSSLLASLAREASAGRLRISPRRVAAIAEPLLPNARAAIRGAWDVPIGNRYGTSEGVFAGFCGHRNHLPDDLCIFEPVGVDGHPVKTGSPSHKVYITNLYNHTLPLIRFEVTDEVTVLGGPCPCGSVFRSIADPQGRLDDTFAYPNGVRIHPHVFRSALAEHHQIVEYQVRQTTIGADIHVVAEAEIDTALVTHKIEEALRALSLHQPSVTITRRAALDRQTTGKLKRFVPLPS
jgi:phenylacetate-CoA ligase